MLDGVLVMMKDIRIYHHISVLRKSLESIRETKTPGFSQFIPILTMTHHFTRESSNVWMTKSRCKETTVRTRSKLSR